MINKTHILAGAALALALVCGSCSNRPLQGVLVPNAQSAEGTSQVAILAATTRAPLSDDAGSMFGSERATATSYAAITVSIPPDNARKIGEVQWPVAPPGDPSRNFVTVAAEHLDNKSFNTAVSAALKKTGRKRVLVFVHGFNNRFDDAVYRFAQIVHDAKAPAVPVLFSWPSRGQVRLIAYGQDRESATASSGALDQLIEGLSLNPNVKEITVLAHSMGSDVALDALRARAARSGKVGDKIKNVLLVAPDVSVDEFKTDIEHLGKKRPRIALFVSHDDAALKVSQVIAGGAQRLGDVNPDEEPYRSDFKRLDIMVFDVSHLQGNPHSRAFDDVTSVMGMIERRLAEGQQLGDPDRSLVNASE